MEDIRGYRRMSLWPFRSFRTYMREKLIDEEDYALTIYVDTRGYLTGGVGRKLSRVKVPEDAGGIQISKATADLWLEEDLDAIERHCSALPYWSRLSQRRRLVVGSMFHQLGAAGLADFRKMAGALNDSDYERAADEILDSLVAREQAPARFYQHAKDMRLG